MSEFSLEKAIANGGKCQTRDGMPARIICADRKSPDWPIVALIGGNEHSISCHSVDGKFTADADPSSNDLLNIPERIKRDVWVNVYAYGCYSWQSQNEAVAHRTDNCLACVKVTIDCEEGEGL